MGVNLFFSATHMKFSSYLISFYEHQIIQTIEINITLSYVLASYTCIGNCEEELPKKPVGPLSADCRPTVGRQLTDSRLTVYRQVKKKEKLNS